MEAFEVLEPGLFSVIQDIGRFNYRRFGIPAVGPMDNFSFRIGNILVGNNENEASLETTVLGPTMIALEDTAVAITGGDLGFTVNDKNVPMWEAIEIKKGDVLKASKILRLVKGCRAYISILGGIDVPIIMGSKSTFISYSIGGIEGRALIRGDVIKRGEPWMRLPNVVGRKTSKEINSMIAEILPDPARKVTILRVILGPFKDHFPPNSIRTFLNSDFTVTPKADRAAYQLEGPEIKHNSKGPDIMTCGHMPGAIQVPGNLKPIIFLHERTGGGYAVVGTVILPDLCKVGQLKPGDKIRFKKVTIREAHSILRNYEENINLFRGFVIGSGINRGKAPTSIKQWLGKTPLPLRVEQA